VWAAIGVSGLNSFAMMHLTIIHGNWLSLEYGLGAGALGTVALILGLVDLSGSFLVSVSVDRIGKRRGVLIGVTGMAAGFLVLPLLNLSAVLAVVSIGVPRLFFEVAIVSQFPLLSEQNPKQRGKIMGLGMTAGLLGAAAAGLTGPVAYQRFGVWGLGPVSLGASVLSILLLLFLVRERPHWQ
jgi:predicted MFS family arabinose efflux permease